MTEVIIHCSFPISQRCRQALMNYSSSALRSFDGSSPAKCMILTAQWEGDIHHCTDWLYLQWTALFFEWGSPAAKPLLQTLYVWRKMRFSLHQASLSNCLSWLHLWQAGWTWGLGCVWGFWAEGCLFVAVCAWCTENTGSPNRPWFVAELVRAEILCAQLSSVQSS